MNIKHQTSNFKINPRSKHQISKYFGILKLVVGICFVVGILMFDVSAMASTVTSSDLLSNPNLYNEKHVTFEGEAIGDIMGHWINLKDRPNTIGIFVEEESELKEIHYLGDYKTIGDTVRVTGTFYKTDPKYGGDLIIRAKKLEVLRLGEKVTHIINYGKLYSIGILLFLLIVVYLIKTFVYKKKSS